MSAPRVLIVDDNAMNTIIAQVVLLAEAFEVETAVDGLDALRKVASFGPDLILMDIQMPGMDGLEVARKLKAEPAWQHIRIVAFTAFAMRGDEANMRSAGCDGYLSKPIDVRKLGAQVRAFFPANPEDMPGNSKAVG